MTDLRALHDAFEELERRADAATAHMALDTSPRTRGTASRSGVRLAPVALAAAVVAGVATGAVLLVPDNGPVTQVAQPSTSSTAPPVTTTSAPPPAHETPEVLAERFRAVLGDLATFVVTETGPGASRWTLPDGPPTGAPSNLTPKPTTQIGSSIGGTLTAAGVTGGFDLLMYPGTAGEKAQCGPDEPGCTLRELPDGSALATSQFALEGSGLTNEVKLTRPDGLVFIMHISNRQSPKGLGPLLGGHPPLTVEQLVQIATSDRW
ncbi:hypothetical protein [Saccharothrix texasensis]|uniref:Uncharacterized protein n=1 Tax=Saccharothrix texasensis TaxID=103734 RepID=A0A3N1GXY6_9PSEU|nr:hypothetical protein [Saccharothrix texasensis]ROP35135.1 hypothetical protein EDD40_0356 [Saccharothrix texasensis]